MKTQYLYFLKYQRSIKIDNDFSWNIGVNYASFSYKDLYITKRTNYNKNSGDTVSLIFKSNSYLLRNDFVWDVMNIKMYIGIGAVYRTEVIKNPIVKYTDSLGNYVINTKPETQKPFHLGFEATFGFDFQMYRNIRWYTEIGMAKAVFQSGVVFKF
jgi:hypothetical protein